MSKRITATVATKPAGPAAAAPPRHYDEAFQRQAVELWLRADQPGTQPPVRAELAAANRALKAELARVREPRDILKKR